MNPSTRTSRIEIAIGLRRSGVPQIDVRAGRPRAGDALALRSYASPEGAALFEAAMDDEEEASTPLPGTRALRGKPGRR